ncbi:MAG: DNA recombination protein RmuC, partial [Holosporaceae bacterium]|nr:DNA recombination protein RmuC [Holosporaceae bacterium]
MTLPIIIIVLLFVSTCCFAFALFSQRAELKKSGKFEGLYFEASAEKSALQERCKNLEEKIKFLENTEEKLTATFKALSSDALFQNNQLFMDLANAVFERFHEKTKSETETGTKTVLNLVDPIKNALSGMGTKLEDLEKARIRAEESLKTQIENLISAQNVLETSAGHLVSVFKAPTIRGRWGEIHLRRVVELAGMVDHCDFEEQVFHEDDDGKIRPDMVVYLPEDRQIVIDAKVPLSAYLKAIETNDPKAKKTLMEEYAKQIRACISDLSGKK